jgi:hypothetical protein
MGLLGQAAMVLSFDVAPDAITEHDDWHTHEHFPERLSIPGFLRGTRWVARHGQPRYFVMYEVEALATLASAAYRERLDNPTPWTAKMMAHYRGMARGFCAVSDSFGVGLGQTGLMIRFKPGDEREAELHEWLVGELAPLSSKAGFASAHVLKAGLTPPSTNEQRIRGSDTAVDWVLLVTGYSVEGATDLFQTRFGEKEFERRGVKGYAGGVYGMAYSLASREL